jgi:hypothetical protein
MDFAISETFCECTKPPPQPLSLFLRVEVVRNAENSMKEWPFRFVVDAIA